ncbi:MAG: efflux RND transporter periplasmic adaptor subunit [Chitinophagaceae bacterium]
MIGLRCVLGTGSRLILYACLSFSLCYVLCCCNSGSAGTQVDSAPGEAALPASGMSVAIERVGEIPFERYVEGNGTVESSTDVIVQSPFAGTMISNRAEDGRQVQAGEIVVSLDKDPVRHQLEAIELEIFRAQKDYESQLIGYSSLLSTLTEKEAGDVKRKLKISSGLATAELRQKELNKILGQTEIRAPFAGVLADVAISRKQLVEQGQSLFRIYDPRALLVRIKVLEGDGVALKKGYSATVVPIVDPAIAIHATVLSINPSVDADGMISVGLSLRDPAARTAASIFPGVHCTARITVPVKRCLVVPKSAVVIRSERPVVFTYNNGLAKWNYVKTGLDNGEKVEILDGLSSGSVVIVSNNLQLAHDSPVSIINP